MHALGMSVAASDSSNQIKTLFLPLLLIGCETATIIHSVLVLHCRKIVKETVDKFGRIDVLVNNASFQGERHSLHSGLFLAYADPQVHDALQQHQGTAVIARWHFLTASHTATVGCW